MRDERSNRGQTWLAVDFAALQGYDLQQLQKRWIGRQVPNLLAIRTRGLRGSVLALLSYRLPSRLHDMVRGEGGAGGEGGRAGC